MYERESKACELEYQAYQEANESHHMFVSGPFDAGFIIQALSGFKGEGSLFSKKATEPDIPEEPQIEE